MQGTDLCRVAVFSVLVSLPTALAAGDAPWHDPDKLVFRETFSTWRQLDPVPSGCDSTDGAFPDGWLPANRPDQGGQYRQTSTPVAGGLDSHLSLNGRLITTATLRIPTNHLIRISFRGRGPGGELTLYMHALSGNTGTMRAVVEACKVRTGEVWQSYQTEMKLLWGLQYARLEIRGDHAEVDDVVLSCHDAQQEQTWNQPRLTIPLVAGRPVIDGIPETGEWDGAVGIARPFKSIANGRQVSRQTLLKMVSDGQNLYLLIRAGRYGRDLKRTIVDADGPVFQDESVELYFNAFPHQERPEEVSFIALNANDTVMDVAEKMAIGQYENTWTCTGIQVKSAQSRHSWDQEIAIPLASIGLATGRLFGFNVSRNMHSPQEYANLTGKPYKDYAHMVLCTIAGSPGIFWNSTQRAGGSDLEAVLHNSAPTPASLVVELHSNFAEKRNQTTPVALAGGTSSTIRMKDHPGASAIGAIGLRVTDTGTQQTLFAFDQELQLAHATAADSDSATPSPRNVVEYLPGFRTLNIRLKDLASRTEADAGRLYATTQVTVQRDGTTVFEQRLTGIQRVGNTGHVAVAFPLTAPGKYALYATILDPAGTCLETVDGSFEIQDCPWLGNDIGKEHVVIPPFTPIEVKANTVSVWGRTYAFNGLGLPAAIHSRQQAVLAAPIGLTVVDGAGREVQVTADGAAAIRSEYPDAATIVGEGEGAGIRVKLSGRIEYDGFLTYDLDLLPQSAVAVRKVSLTIPFCNLAYLHTTGNRRTPKIYMMNPPAQAGAISEHVGTWHAAYDYSKSRSQYHPLYFPPGDGLVWSSLGVKSPDIYGNFLPYVWLGNPDYGIGWLADSDRGWINDADAPCVEVVRTGGNAVLQVNFIATPTTLDEPRHIRFAVVATPVRPRIKGANVVMQTGMEGFNCPYVKGTQGIRYREDDLFYIKKRKIDENSRGASSHLYFANDLLNKTDEGLQYMGSEWYTDPYYEIGSASAMGSFLERRRSSDIRDMTCVKTTAVPSRTDYYLYWFEHYMKNQAIDGIYLDNSYPSASASIHQGDSGGYLRSDGILQGGFALFEMRNMLKRIAVTAYRSECLPRYESIHISGAMIPGCLSFAEWYLDGESLVPAGSDFMDYWRLPIVEIFGAGSWGGNQAWMPLACGAFVTSETHESRTALATLKLYDMNLTWGKINQQLMRELQDLEKDFGIDQPDCEFVGYWRRPATLGQLPDGVRCSYYRRPGKGVLLYLTNFNHDAVKCAIAPDFAAADLPRIQLLDAETGEPVADDNARFTFAIPKRDFRVLRMVPPEPIAAP